MADGWTLDRECLRRALDGWLATAPGPSTRDRVNDFLMDLVKDPLRQGVEELDHPGIFFGRVPGTNIGVTFVPDTAQRSVCIVFIA